MIWVMGSPMNAGRRCKGSVVNCINIIYIYGKTFEVERQKEGVISTERVSSFQ